MRTVTRLGLLIAIPTALFSGAASAVDAITGAAPASVGPVLVLQADSPAQLELVRWAVSRYERAGLRLPPVAVVFHDDEIDCHARRGYYLSGRVDLCTGDRVDPQVRDTFLHELAHAWTEANLTLADTTAFLRLRSLSSWNSGDEIWPRRGFEQAAEVISWSLGERILSPEIPDHEPAEMFSAYEILTGIEPPER
jgi:hypothetical protein